MKKNQRKVMVVEDSEHTRFLVNAILQTLGYQVIEAEDGKVAKDLLSDEKVFKDLDAVFLDVLMPNINGIELLKWIKGREALCSLPVLMLTTKDMAEDLIEGYGSGADYYIPKPFTRDQIKFGLELLVEGEAVKTA